MGWLKILFGHLKMKFELLNQRFGTNTHYKYEKALSLSCRFKYTKKIKNNK